jgi:hypothetical protein
MRHSLYLSRTGEVTSRQVHIKVHIMTDAHLSGYAWLQAQLFCVCCWLLILGETQNHGLLCALLIQHNGGNINKLVKKRGILNTPRERKTVSALVCLLQTFGDTGKRTARDKKGCWRF